MPAHPSRRKLLLAASTLPLLGGPAWSQALRPAAGRSPEVIQIVDSSPGQLDVSRDFLIGSRAAWQDFNTRGGWRGRPIQHTVLEVDGTAASLQQALNDVRSMPQCLALCGTAGHRAASELIKLLQVDTTLEIAHVAPWLHREPLAGMERTFPIFASQQEQTSYALKCLSVVGVTEVGVVYSSRQEQTLNQGEFSALARDLKLRYVPYVPSGTLQQLGQQLTPQTPAILIFLGGTPELAQFTLGLEKQDRQRYVIALADVNLRTLNQLGPLRSASVMGTQVVPVVTSSLPIVRSYRHALNRLFDEPPTPQSLAGFIAARYTQEVLMGLEPGATRAQVLQAFQRRSLMDLAGFRISFQAQRRTSAYVTQSMLTADGRMLG